MAIGAAAEAVVAAALGEAVILLAVEALSSPIIFIFIFIGVIQYEDSVLDQPYHFGTLEFNSLRSLYTCAFVDICLMKYITQNVFKITIKS